LIFGQSNCVTNNAKTISIPGDPFFFFIVKKWFKLENVQNFKLYFETWKDMSEYLISDVLIDSICLYANRETIQTQYKKWTAVINVSIIGIPRLSFIICHFAKGYRLTNISDHPAPGKVPKKKITRFIYGSFLWLLSMVPLYSTRNKEIVNSNESLHCLFWAKTEIIKFYLFV
jgi:hypothetical protein